MKSLVVTRSLLLMLASTVALAACGPSVLAPGADGDTAGSSGTAGNSGTGGAGGASPAPAVRSPRLAVSGLHTCAIGVSGGLRCWGSTGALGVGDLPNSHVPAAVVGLSSGVAAVVAGPIHTCALTEEGTVLCWGDDNHGQLGNDAAEKSSPLPVPAQGLPAGITSIAAGFHTCALTATGTLRCWGMNAAGELGNGTTQDSALPVEVEGLATGVRAVDASELHTCAILGSGAVRCWGANEWGQLGDGTTVDRALPVEVEGLPAEVIALSPGGGHTCALTATGAVHCWGRNDWGQLGDGTTELHLAPVATGGLPPDVIAIAAAAGHTCALTATSKVLCWGWNDKGQLGNGTTDDRATPGEVAGLPTDLVAIAAGGEDTCVIGASGKVQCWGYNASGALGDGTFEDRLTPVDVIGSW